MLHLQDPSDALTFHPLDVIFIAGDPESEHPPGFEHVALVAKGVRLPRNPVHPKHTPKVLPDGSQVAEREEQILGLHVYGLPENDPTRGFGANPRIAPVLAGPHWQARIAWNRSAGGGPTGDPKVVWNLAGRALNRKLAREAELELSRRLRSNRLDGRDTPLKYQSAFRMTDFGGPARQSARAEASWPMPHIPFEAPPPFVESCNCLSFVLSVLALRQFEPFNIVQDQWDEPSYPDPYDSTAPERRHPSPGHLAYALREDAQHSRVRFGTNVARYSRAVETLRDLRRRPNP